MPSHDPPTPTKQSELLICSVGVSMVLREKEKLHSHHKATDSMSPQRGLRNM